MKLISSISIVFSLLAIIFWGQPEGHKNAEVMITKTANIEKQKTNMMIFDNGVYSQEITNPDNSTEKSSGILTEADLSSLKKLIRNCRPITLKNEYACNKEVDRENYTLFVFNNSSHGRKVLIDNGCNFPKKLKNLDLFLSNLVTAD